jgi:hypothetical protein
MCLLLTLLLLGPRAAIVLYWLAWPARWDVAFDSFLVPFLGFVIAPWTTLMWVIVAPSGVDGFDYVLLFLAVLFDLGSLGAGGGSRRRRSPSPQRA